jgi:hypothetical protein
VAVARGTFPATTSRPPPMRALSSTAEAERRKGHDIERSPVVSAQEAPPCTSTFAR